MKREIKNVTKVRATTGAEIIGDSRDGWGGHLPTGCRARTPVRDLEMSFSNPLTWLRGGEYQAFCGGAEYDLQNL
jgi:hypothetical protein